MTRLVCLSRNQHHLFAPLYTHFEVLEVDTWTPEYLSGLGFDVLLTPSCDWYEAHHCIEFAKARRIPTLYVMDGIIEWRHEWENPAYGAGGGIAFNQPLTTDKAACLGWQSARTLADWGNAGKCEIVGSPRFDHYLETPVSWPQRSGAKRLLILTANTPGFTPEQIALVETALNNVNIYLQTQTEWQPIWRVRKGLDAKLGLADDFPELRGKPLRAALEQADAVLTTPSTVLLEAMLAGRPTALLDYSNSPAYVPAAWTIMTAAQIQPALTDMLNPPTKRMLFQDEVLHNCLECASPALPRLVALIEALAAAGQQARREHQPLELPATILPPGAPHQSAPEFDLSRLYPDHPVYGNQDIAALQQELALARQENVDLQRQLRKLRRRTLLATFMRKVLKREA